ncbi:hypothetical protein QQ020_07435 [Fulvivirgaceae bacterium BMA12]|uniref:DUF4252 domain-containing protein n=1 Tax=Agaribacillus aureus TaxID=3051825 RepID=A0ABT8L4A8_9BACT|nr:hypothetical protein [Fulvivirgaceae bacterium BMA12]
MKNLIITTLLLFSFSITKAQDTNPELVASIHEMLNDCSYYEVSEEMFKAVAEDERLQGSEYINYLEKIRFLIFVECPMDRKGFFEEFVARADLRGFKVMMRSKSASEQFTFYRQTKGDLNSYLLVHNRGVSYIVTQLKISSLQELSQIVQMAGSMGAG